MNGQNSNGTKARVGRRRITQQPKPSKNLRRNKGRNKGEADSLVELCRSLILCHTQDGEAYALMEIGGVKEVVPVNSTQFTDWLRTRYEDRRNKVPGKNAVRNAVEQISARARTKGKKIDVHVRLATTNDALYIDLCDDRRQIVEVTANGWKIVNDAPVYFKRPPEARPLPTPTSGGDLEDLRKSINIDNDEDWHLVRGFLLGAFMGPGPHAVLVLTGEQGSLKSTLMRRLCALIDPQSTEEPGPPKEEQDLVIRADNSWMVYFGNVSSLSPELSNAICRLATGSGLRKRKLYTDKGEISINVCRPVILNGIPDFVWALDLEDRSIAVEMTRIPDAARKTKRSSDADFERERPGIFGAVLDALVNAMKYRDSVQLNKKPRLADQAEWITAAEKNLRGGTGCFVDALTDRQAERMRSVAEADSVTPALMKLANNGPFEGTLTEMLAKLSAGGSSSGIPNTARSLGGKLREIAPGLRAKGLVVEPMERKAGSRPWRIALTADSGDGCDGGSDKSTGGKQENKEQGER